MTDIHWNSAVDGAFDDGADWTGHAVPKASDDAILDATGAPYMVTAAVSATVNGIQLASYATLAIARGTLTATAGTDGGVNAGAIVVTHGAVFQTGGVLDNTGGITLSGAGSDLRLLSDTTLTGGGVLEANYGAYGNYTQILGAAPVTLTNVDNTIIGAGQIGDSAGFCLVNEAGAVIEADVLQHRLILGSSSYPGDQIVNDGLMSAAAGNHSASSFLEIDHATVSGAGGTIAAGADSNVAIMYSQVSGQTFSAAPGGQIQIFHSRIALGGTLDDPGLLQLSAVVLTIDSGLTLTGGGAMVIHGGRMVGDRAGVTLTNVDGAISMVKADLGAGKLALTNEAHGTILCEGAIDTGARTITNAGLMESDANRRQVRGVIMSALKNTGTLSTGTGGTLVFDDAVTGSGRALISSNKFGGGLLGFTSSFDENVTFSRHKDSDPVSVLQLAKSQSYAATITGFSSTGKTRLDLGDIGFVDASQATFSGTAKSGVLTVSDGTHTAHIDLVGDFLGSTFVAASDAHGGISIVATTGDAPSAPAFVSAMAGLGGRSSAPIHAEEAAYLDVRAVLLAPRGQLA
jgi:hypothetical protein